MTSLTHPRQRNSSPLLHSFSSTVHFRSLLHHGVTVTPILISLFLHPSRFSVTYLVVFCAAKRRLPKYSLSGWKISSDSAVTHIFISAWASVMRDQTSYFCFAEGSVTRDAQKCSKVYSIPESQLSGCPSIPIESSSIRSVSDLTRKLDVDALPDSFRTIFPTPRDSFLLLHQGGFVLSR